MPLHDDADSGAKRKRVTRACDKCHRNGSKCSRSDGEHRCVRCIELGIPCTFDRPVKRRGPPARRAGADEGSPATSGQTECKPPTGTRSRGSQGSLRDSLGHGTPRERLSGASSSTPRDTAASASFWRYDDLLDVATVDALADIYYRTAYPLRPFLHWPTILSDLRAGRYRSNWGVFVVTMAMCAMAAGKLADGGVPGHVPQTLSARGGRLAEECYRAAELALDHADDHLSDDADIVPLLKAQALLACTAMQSGNHNAALVHYGEYSILSAQAHFHDEATWPADVTEIQRQERRRLFWFAYQCDQYNSTCFGLVPRHREARANVLYPAEADDDDITDATVSPRAGHVSFMRGWNVCTDLYRVLEHVYDNLRADPAGNDENAPGHAVTAFLSQRRVDSHAALRLVERLLGELPPELRRVNAMTGDTGADRLGFIAMNIIITSQKLKMLIALSDGSSVHQRCAIASELLDGLATLPAVYLRACSATTLEHLAHVGHLLSGVIDGPLPTWTYLQVRNILLVLSEFIGTLETSRSTPSDLAAKLREQIQRIDENMSQSEGSMALPMSESLMPSLPAPAGKRLVTDMVNEASALQETQTATQGPGTAESQLDSTLIPAQDMISIDDGLAPLPPEDAPVPPHDALATLQLGSGQPTSPAFTALGFAASHGMFDFGVAPMDDALIGEFLRYWPAQGILADTVQDGTPFSGM